MKRLKSSGTTVLLDALKTLYGQLWYLSEELDALGFIDQGVDTVEKRTMVEVLANQGTEDPPKRITVDHTKISGKQLLDIVTHNAKSFFHTLAISDSLLTADPET
jgi:hypothetical protein